MVSPVFVRCTPPPEIEHSYQAAPRSASHWNTGAALAIVPTGNSGLGGEMMNFMPLLQAPVEPEALARTLHVRSTFAGSAFMRWREVPRWPLKKRRTLFPRKI